MLRLVSRVLLPFLILSAPSIALAQDSDIVGTYATEKGACGQTGEGPIRISEGALTGPGFECELGKSRPAGTGLVFYEASCVVDGRLSTKGIALDLGNYADHFELSLPRRQGWMSLYPCSKGAGAKSTGGSTTGSGQSDADAGPADLDEETELPAEQPVKPAAQPAKKPEPTRSPKVKAYLKRYDDFIRRIGISDLTGKSLLVESCAGCVPYIINCRGGARSPADLRGKKARVSPATKDFVHANGGAGEMLPGGEVAIAFDAGVIDCAVGGGVRTN